jgi:hypothetical protein
LQFIQTFENIFFKWKERPRINRTIQIKDNMPDFLHTFSGLRKNVQAGLFHPLFQRLFNGFQYDLTAGGRAGNGVNLQRLFLNDGLGYHFRWFAAPVLMPD